MKSTTAAGDTTAAPSEPPHTSRRPLLRLRETHTAYVRRAPPPSAQPLAKGDRRASLSSPKRRHTAPPCRQHGAAQPSTPVRTPSVTPVLATVPLRRPSRPLSRRHENACDAVVASRGVSVSSPVRSEARPDSGSPHNYSSSSWTPLPPTRSEDPCGTASPPPRSLTAAACDAVKPPCRQRVQPSSVSPLTDLISGVSALPPLASSHAGVKGGVASVPHRVSESEPNQAPSGSWSSPFGNSTSSSNNNSVGVSPNSRYARRSPYQYGLPAALTLPLQGVSGAAEHLAGSPAGPQLTTSPLARDRGQTPTDIIRLSVSNSSLTNAAQRGSSAGGSGGRNTPRHKTIREAADALRRHSLSLHSQKQSVSSIASSPHQYMEALGSGSNSSALVSLSAGLTHSSSPMWTVLNTNNINHHHHHHNGSGSSSTGGFSGGTAGGADGMRLTSPLSTPPSSQATPMQMAAGIARGEVWPNHVSSTPASVGVNDYAMDSLTPTRLHLVVDPDGRAGTAAQCGRDSPAVAATAGEEDGVDGVVSRRVSSAHSSGNDSRPRTGIFVETTIEPSRGGLGGDGISTPYPSSGNSPATATAPTSKRPHAVAPFQPRVRHGRSASPATGDGHMALLSRTSGDAGVTSHLGSPNLSPLARAPRVGLPLCMSGSGELRESVLFGITTGVDGSLAMLSSLGDVPPHTVHSTVTPTAVLPLISANSATGTTSDLTIPSQHASVLFAARNSSAGSDGHDEMRTSTAVSCGDVSRSTVGGYLHTHSGSDHRTSTGSRSGNNSGAPQTPSAEDATSPTAAAAVHAPISDSPRPASHGDHRHHATKNSTPGGGEPDSHKHSRPPTTTGGSALLGEWLDSGTGSSSLDPQSGTAAAPNAVMESPLELSGPLDTPPDRHRSQAMAQHTSHASPYSQSPPPPPIVLVKPLLTIRPAGLAASDSLSRHTSSSSATPGQPVPLESIMVDTTTANNNNNNSSSATSTNDGRAGVALSNSLTAQANSGSSLSHETSTRAVPPAASTANAIGFSRLPTMPTPTVPMVAATVAAANARQTRRTSVTVVSPASMIRKQRTAAGRSSSHSSNSGGSDSGSDKEEEETVPLSAAFAEAQCTASRTAHYALDSSTQAEGETGALALTLLLRHLKSGGEAVGGDMANPHSRHHSLLAQSVSLEGDALLASLHSLDYYMRHLDELEPSTISQLGASTQRSTTATQRPLSPSWSHGVVSTPTKTTSTSAADAAMAAHSNDVVAGPLPPFLEAEEQGRQLTDNGATDSMVRLTDGGRSHDETGGSSGGGGDGVCAHAATASHGVGKSDSASTISTAKEMATSARSSVIQAAPSVAHLGTTPIVSSLFTVFPTVARTSSGASGLPDEGLAGLRSALMTLGPLQWAGGAASGRFSVIDHTNSPARCSTRGDHYSHSTRSLSTTVPGSVAGECRPSLTWRPPPHTESRDGNVEQAPMGLPRHTTVDLDTATGAETAPTVTLGEGSREVADVGSVSSETSRGVVSPTALDREIVVRPVAEAKETPVEWDGSPQEAASVPEGEQRWDWCTDTSSVLRIAALEQRLQWNVLQASMGTEWSGIDTVPSSTEAAPSAVMAGQQDSPALTPKSSVGVASLPAFTTATGPAAQTLVPSLADTLECLGAAGATNWYQPTPLEASITTSLFSHALAASEVSGINASLQRPPVLSHSRSVSHLDLGASTGNGSTVRRIGSRRHAANGEGSFTSELIRVESASLPSHGSRRVAPGAASGAMTRTGRRAQGRGFNRKAPAAGSGEATHGPLSATHDKLRGAPEGQPRRHPSHDFSALPENDAQWTYMAMPRSRAGGVSTTSEAHSTGSRNTNGVMWVDHDRSVLVDGEGIDGSRQTAYVPLVANWDSTGYLSSVATNSIVADVSDTSTLTSAAPTPRGGADAANISDIYGDDDNEKSGADDKTALDAPMVRSLLKRSTNTQEDTSALMSVEDSVDNGPARLGQCRAALQRLGRVVGDDSSGSPHLLPNSSFASSSLVLSQVPSGLPSRGAVPHVPSGYAVARRVRSGAEMSLTRLSSRFSFHDNNAEDGDDERLAEREVKAMFESSKVLRALRRGVFGVNYTLHVHHSDESENQNSRLYEGSQADNEDSLSSGGGNGADDVVHEDVSGERMGRRVSSGSIDVRAIAEAKDGDVLGCTFPNGDIECLLDPVDFSLGELPCVLAMEARQGDDDDDVGASSAQHDTEQPARTASSSRVPSTSHTDSASHSLDASPKARGCLSVDEGRQTQPRAEPPARPRPPKEGGGGMQFLRSLTPCHALAVVQRSHTAEGDVPPPSVPSTAPCPAHDLTAPLSSLSVSATPLSVSPPPPPSRAAGLAPPWPHHQRSTLPVVAHSGGNKAALAPQTRGQLTAVSPRSSACTNASATVSEGSSGAPLATLTTSVWAEHRPSPLWRPVDHVTTPQGSAHDQGAATTTTSRPLDASIFGARIDDSSAEESLTSLRWSCDSVGD